MIHIKAHNVPVYPDDPLPFFAVGTDQRTGLEARRSQDYATAADAVAELAAWCKAEGRRYTLAGPRRHQGRTLGTKRSNP